MINVSIQDSMQKKLEILSAAAKYDVACTSSGVDRKGKKDAVGNARACGICHSFSADGRCISLLKILMSNHCIYDCKYCINRRNNDIPRASFTPSEICELTLAFYKRNYIEGLFLSSGVIKSPAYTMEGICETLFLLRSRYRFNGYVHVKAIPGAPRELLLQAGRLADRMSVNLELPTEEGLRSLAPHKSLQSILNPMQSISREIAQSRLLLGKDAGMERSSLQKHLPNSIFYPERRIAMQENSDTGSAAVLPRGRDWETLRERPFVPAGQSTQILIGATAETDYDILKSSEYLYQSYDLKRVFYSAYIPLNEDAALPPPGSPVPLLREHRLYQADWLLRFYGFRADELLSRKEPDFHVALDPKCHWALRNLQLFPVAVERADYAALLRVPGIGPVAAKRIVSARRWGALDFDSLKKMGVVLKRAHYFITCGGRMLHRIPLEESFIRNSLSLANRRENWELSRERKEKQLSLFEDFGLEASGRERA